MGRAGARRGEPAGGARGAARRRLPDRRHAGPPGHRADARAAADAAGLVRSAAGAGAPRLPRRLAPGPGGRRFDERGDRSRRHRRRLRRLAAAVARLPDLLQDRHPALDHRGHLAALARSRRADARRARRGRRRGGRPGALHRAPQLLDHRQLHVPAGPVRRPGRAGQGLGRALIEHVYAEAAARGCARVWWLTHESNTDAMVLYDRIADRSGFVQYRKVL